MVVLVGSSSTGKTRACWEAVQPLAAEGWRLWHPYDPTRAEAALAGIEHVAARTVVWLNEAQHYLGDVMTGERVAAALHTLLTHNARRPVLILGTLWPNYADQYASLPQSGGPDPHSRVRELLAGRTFTIPDAFGPEALRTAEALAEGGDVLLADALARAREHGRITQDLAGAPELLRRFEHGSPAAKALLEAAMDARRLGVGLHLPRAFLAEAAPGYLADYDFDQLTNDWSEAAFTELAHAVHGKLSPLLGVKARPSYRPPGIPAPLEAPDVEPGPVFRLADYLEQHGRTTRQRLCPPASFWAAAHAHLTKPDDLHSLANAARTRRRLQWSYHLGLRAFDSGHTDALVTLASVLEALGDGAGADVLYQRAADTGNVFAMFHVAGTHEGSGDYEVAQIYAQRAADAGDQSAHTVLTRIRELTGDRNGAEILAEYAAEAGAPEALYVLAGLREAANDHESAVDLFKRAANMGATPALTALARLRESAGDYDGAIYLFRQASDAGDSMASVMLTQILVNLGDVEGAEALAFKAADARNLHPLSLLSAMRQWAGDHEGAREFAQLAASGGYFDALLHLSRTAEGSGRHEEAENLARQAAEAGDPIGLGELARLRELAGDREGAEKLTFEAVDTRHPSALITLAQMRERAGDHASATALYRLAADAGQVFDEERWPHGLDPDGSPSPPWHEKGCPAQFDPPPEATPSVRTYPLSPHIGDGDGRGDG
ncbi:hypothetical protein AB0H29_08870 [Streptomyces thermolilacinus]